MYLLPADISGVSYGHGEVNADVFDMHRVSVRDKRFRCGCPATRVMGTMVSGEVCGDETWLRHYGFGRGQAVWL